MKRIQILYKRSFVRAKSDNVIEAIIQFLANGKYTREGSGCSCYCIFSISHSALTGNFIMILTKVVETKLFQSSQSSGIYKTFVHIGYFPLF